MALWFKNLVFIPLLALALMLGNGNYHSCELEKVSHHNAMAMASDMPCHDISAQDKMKMDAHQQGDKQHNNCCDNSCTCSYGHCNGTIAMAAPNFEISPQFIGNTQSPKAVAFAIIEPQSPPERPPKNFS